MVLKRYIPANRQESHFLIDHMEKLEINKEKEPDAVKLKRLIENDPHTMSLTAAQMALREIESGNVHSALERLRVDLDKLYITNKQLYDYIQSFKNSDRNTPK